MWHLYALIQRFLHTYFQPWSFSLALDQRSADFFWKGPCGLHLTYSAPAKSYRNSHRQAAHEQPPRPQLQTLLSRASYSCFSNTPRSSFGVSGWFLCLCSRPCSWSPVFEHLAHAQAHWDPVSSELPFRQTLHNTCLLVHSIFSDVTRRSHPTHVCIFTECRWVKHFFVHIILACASMMLFKDGCSYFCCRAVARDIAGSCAFSPVRVLWLLIRSSGYIISTSLTRPRLLEI